MATVDSMNTLLSASISQYGTQLAQAAMNTQSPFTACFGANTTGNYYWNPVPNNGSVQGWGTVTISPNPIAQAPLKAKLPTEID